MILLAEKCEPPYKTYLKWGRLKFQKGHGRKSGARFGFFPFGLSSPDYYFAQANFGIKNPWRQDPAGVMTLIPCGECSIVHAATDR